MSTISINNIPTPVLSQIFVYASDKGNEISFIKTIQLVCKTWKTTIEDPQIVLVFIKRYNRSYQPQKPLALNDHSFKSLLKVLLRYTLQNTKPKPVVNYEQYLENHSIAYSQEKTFYLGQVVIVEKISDKATAEKSPLIDDFFLGKNHFYC